jgi:hypothetical protein
METDYFYCGHALFMIRDSLESDVSNPPSFFCFKNNNRVDAAICVLHGKRYDSQLGEYASYAIAFLE